MLLNCAEFAKLAAVSKPAITKAKKAGRVIVKNGKVDTENAVNILYLQRVRGRKAEKVIGLSRGAPKRPEGGGGSEGSLVHQKLKLEVAFRYEQIINLRLRRLKNVERLLDRVIVEQALVKFNVELEIHLMDMPRRIAPRLFALVKSDKAQEALQLFEDEIGTAIKRAKEGASL